MTSRRDIPRLLEALADDMNMRIVRCLMTLEGSARTSKIAAELSETDTRISRHLQDLEDILLIERGKGRAPHVLVDLPQTTRAIRELRRLSISLRRDTLKEDEDDFERDEWLIAGHPERDDWNYAWDEAWLPDPPRPVLWQRTHEPGIVTLGPEEGVLVRSRQPLVVFNSDYLPFRTLISGLMAGDLEIDPLRAVRRATAAVQSLAPEAKDDLPLSRHRGWRDATEHVYTHPQLGAELRKYLRIAGDESTPS
jgi:DNA-binding MarR family transcriptional regulator